MTTRSGSILLPQPRDPTYLNSIDFTKFRNVLTPPSVILSEDGLPSKSKDLY